MLEEKGVILIKVGIFLYEFLKRLEVIYELFEELGKGVGDDVLREVKE